MTGVSAWQISGVRSVMNAQWWAIAQLCLIVASGCRADRESRKEDGKFADAPPWGISDQYREVGSRDDFFDISAALIYGEGVLVVHRGDPALLLYDANGRVSATAGRKGMGPGELVNSRVLGILSADTLVIFDSEAMRISFYCASLRFCGNSLTWTFAGKPVSINGDFLLVETVVESSVGDVIFSRHRFFLLDRRKEQLSMDPVFEAPGLSYWTAKDSSGFYRGRIPLTVAPQASALADGFLFVNKTKPELVFTPAPGRRDQAARILLTGLERRSVTAREMEVELNEMTGPTGRRFGSEIRRAAGIVLPELERPIIRRALVSSDREIWLELETPDTLRRQWAVIGESGGIRDRLSVPWLLRLTDVAAGRVVGIWNNTDGVETIRSYGIVSSAPSKE